MEFPSGVVEAIFAVLLILPVQFALSGSNLDPPLNDINADLRQVVARQIDYNQQYFSLTMHIIKCHYDVYTTVSGEKVENLIGECRVRCANIKNSYDGKAEAFRARAEWARRNKTPGGGKPNGDNHS
jgi:hypothetical protein